MQAYKYSNKDKSILIYIRGVEELANGDTIYKKIYLQPKGMFLKAYVRSLSASERATSDSINQSNDIEVVINYRYNLEYRVDGFIEYAGKTYAITSIDVLDFKHTEMKLTARSVEPPTFNSVEYLERKKRG